MYVRLRLSVFLLFIYVVAWLPPARKYELREPWRSGCEETRRRWFIDNTYASNGQGCETPVHRMEGSYKNVQMSVSVRRLLLPPFSTYCSLCRWSQ